MTKSPAHQGFSLVEVTLAIGLTAFCLVAIFGLLPIGLSASHSAIEQTEANGVVTMVAADLRATRSQTPQEKAGETPVNSPQFSIPVPPNPVEDPASTTLYFTDDGKTTASPQGARYRMTVSFPPNGNDIKTATYVHLQVTWPATAPVGKAIGKAQTFIAVDRN